MYNEQVGVRTIQLTDRIGNPAPHETAILESRWRRKQTLLRIAEILVVRKKQLATALHAKPRNERYVAKLKEVIATLKELLAREEKRNEIIYGKPAVDLVIKRQMEESNRQLKAEIEVSEALSVQNEEDRIMLLTTHPKEREAMQERQMRCDELAILEGAARAREARAAIVAKKNQNTK